MKPHISINQFAEFSKSSEKAKARIIGQQLKPSKVLIQWYPTAKASMRQYLKNVKDFTPIREGIKKLLQQKPTKKNQVNNRNVSVEALEKMIQLRIARYFKEIKYEVIKPGVKTINCQGVDIRISPEIVFKASINGKVLYGGVKIHISKRKPFDLSQCQFISTLLSRYIKENIAKKGETVAPELCLCIDVFGDRIVMAKGDDNNEIQEIKKLCDEIKSLWPKNAA